MAAVSRAVEELVLGELNEFQSSFRDCGVREYLLRIRRKTASLIEVSCLLGAELAGLGKSEVRAAGRYGRYIGMAFQFRDDLLDITGDERVGKHLLADLRQGVLTLPLLHAVKSRLGIRVLEFIENFRESEAEKQGLLELLSETGSLACTTRVLRNFVSHAVNELDTLPECPEREALARIAEFTALRCY